MLREDIIHIQRRLHGLATSTRDPDLKQALIELNRVRTRLESHVYGD